MSLGVSLLFCWVCAFGDLETCSVFGGDRDSTVAETRLGKRLRFAVLRCGRLLIVALGANRPPVVFGLPVATSDGNLCEYRRPSREACESALFSARNVVVKSQSGECDSNVVEGACLSVGRRPLQSSRFPSGGRVQRLLQCERRSSKRPLTVADCLSVPPHRVGGSRLRTELFVWETVGFRLLGWACATSAVTGEACLSEQGWLLEAPGRVR